MNIHPRIIIDFVPASQMRYVTLGDWTVAEDGSITITVSEKSGSPTEQFLVALHELAEIKLCEAMGIDQQMVDDFDFKFTGKGEPGDDWRAPYREQHRQAMLIEHLMANFLGLSNYGSVT